jgi:hypothetical protein
MGEGGGGAGLRKGRVMEWQRVGGWELEVKDLRKDAG